MKLQSFRRLSRLVPLSALVLACGMAQAANPPRVMFVSGADLQPVLIDLNGKEIPARKGVVIPPGYSVKVPEGATVQIMTDEKAIVAIRQNSLLKLEKLGDGNEPHKFKLDIGGLRVANSEKKPHKFEVDTPNAKIRFDKGDHEAYYFKEGKIPDKWGTFVRGFKEDSMLTTKDGETKITPRDYGYVPGTGSGKPEVFARIDPSGKPFVDPVSFTPGSKPDAISKLNQNQEGMKNPVVLDPVGPRSTPRGFSPAPEIVGSKVLPLPPIVAKLDPKSVPDPNLMRQLKIGTLPTGEKVVLDLRPQSVGVVSQKAGESVTFTRTQLETAKETAKLPPIEIVKLPPVRIEKVTCSGRKCF